MFVVKGEDYPVVQRLGIVLAVIGALIGLGVLVVIIWIFIAVSSW